MDTVKRFDLTARYKLVQQKNLPVYIEKDIFGKWSIGAGDVQLHEFSDKDGALDFCRELGFKIMGIIIHKFPREDIFE